MRDGALGHGISDADTGERLEISDGDLYRADILSIRKGTAGTPGELRGVINYREENRIGTICGNSQYGIRGQANALAVRTSGSLKCPPGFHSRIHGTLSSFSHAKPSRMQSPTCAITGFLVFSSLSPRLR